MKKILLLVRNKKQKLNKNKTKKKICVVGVSPNVGVTHLSLALANFIHSVLGKKVIYVELSENSQLLSVVGMKQVMVGNFLAYDYKGVKYILSNDVDAIRNLMLTENAWFIVDMADLNEETQTIFTNCNNRIVIGSLSPWCQREYYEFIDNQGLLEYDTSQMTYLKINREKTKKIESDFNNHAKSTIMEMPIINDPFSLEENMFQVLMKLVR